MEETKTFPDDAPESGSMTPDSDPMDGFNQQCNAEELDADARSLLLAVGTYLTVPEGENNRVNKTLSKDGRRIAVFFTQVIHQTGATGYIRYIISADKRFKANTQNGKPEFDLPYKLWLQAVRAYKQGTQDSSPTISSEAVIDYLATNAYRLRIIQTASLENLVVTISPAQF